MISIGPPASGRGIARPPLPPGPLDSGGVELALNPEEVDLMDTDAMTVRAEAALREKQVCQVVIEWLQIMGSTNFLSPL